MIAGRFQARLTVPPSVLVAGSPVGEGHVAVVKVTGSLGSDTLPAVSTATTVRE